jgi:hypothetical protein
MTPPSAANLVKGIQETLTARHIDFEAVIRDFGQVEAAERRASGHRFEMRDHIRGLVLSLLSNQRPWKPIADNKARIAAIFLQYDPDALADAGPATILRGLRNIRCGNRADVKQVSSLAENIATLRRIEERWGSLDAFVASAPPDTIARRLSDVGSYKIKQLGYALAMEYLKNVGIRAGKPDLHIRRILGSERLGYAPDHPNEAEAFELIAMLAADAGRDATYLDNLLWMFCAEGYGNVCGAVPQCGACRLARDCRYPKGGASTNRL